nr:MAG TPA: hypothetical protein [Caudoviricetes sp.]
MGNKKLCYLQFPILLYYHLFIYKKSSFCS